MEGLAVGRAIITSNIAGCRETVIDNSNGFFCAAKDSESLLQACTKFINLTPLEREKMAHNSRLLAEATFDDKLVIEYYNKIIQR